MYSGGEIPVRQINDNSYSFAEKPSSVTESSASSPYSTQTDNFAISEGSTNPYVPGGYNFASPYFSPEILLDDPYEVARLLTDRTRQSSDNEKFMELLEQLVSGPRQQLLDVMRAIFEIGYSHPAGSNERLNTVYALFSTLTIADQRGNYEAAFTIGEFLETLGYALHVTVEPGPDNGDPRAVTYQISGPAQPDEESAAPAQEEPPADVPPPARRRPPRPREQVAMVQEPPTADMLPENQGPVATAPGQESPTVPETGPADLQENGDSLALGFATFDEIFAETANDERTAFLAERSKRRGTLAAPTLIGDDMVVAPLICGCSDGED